MLLIFNSLHFAKKFYCKYTKKIFDTYKTFSKNLVNEHGNIPLRGVAPKFSDLEVLALSVVAEECGFDSENRLFMVLKIYKSMNPNLISRRQYNDRRKLTKKLCKTNRWFVCPNNRQNQYADFRSIFQFLNNKPIGKIKYAQF